MMNCFSFVCCNQPVNNYDNDNKLTIIDVDFLDTELKSMGHGYDRRSISKEDELENRAKKVAIVICFLLGLGGWV